SLEVIVGQRPPSFNTPETPPKVRGKQGLAPGEVAGVEHCQALSRTMKAGGDSCWYALCRTGPRRGASWARTTPVPDIPGPPLTTLQEVRARCARDLGLPFTDSLSERSILEALNEHGVPYRNRLFNPIPTVWGFLSQVLSEDRSCRDTVSRILAHRAASGL